MDTKHPASDLQDGFRDSFRSERCLIWVSRPHMHTAKRKPVLESASRQTAVKTDGLPAEVFQSISGGGVTFALVNRGTFNQPHHITVSKNKLCIFF